MNVAVVIAPTLGQLQLQGSQCQEQHVDRAEIDKTHHA